MYTSIKRLLMQILLITPVAKAASKALPEMEIGRNESTYTIAKWIMDLDYMVLDFIGLEHHHTLFIWIYAALVFLIAFGIGYAVKWLTIAAVRMVGKRVKTNLYHNLQRHEFFIKLSRIIPAIVFLIFIQFTMTAHASLGTWLTRLTWIYMIFATAKAINTLIDVVWEHFDARENKRQLPLKGLVQLAKGIIWILVAIVAVAIIVDKSPTSLLAGLGAFAAVLMLEIGRASCRERV